jgi:hypothetical protein
MIGKEALLTIALEIKQREVSKILLQNISAHRGL